MKMRVLKTVQYETNPHIVAVDAMRGMVGKIIDVEKQYNKDQKFHYYKGTGGVGGQWNWVEEWLEPVNPNEAWFESLKEDEWIIPF